MTRCHMDRAGFELLLSLLPPGLHSHTAYLTSIGYDVEIVDDLDEGEDDE